jgi:hypothetical protein
MGSLVRKLLLVALAAAGALAAVAGSAPAAHVSLDLEVRIIASNDQNGFSYADGQTHTVNALKFFGGVRVLGISGADMSVATVRIELPSGLSWGANVPKPSQGCTGGQVVVCQSRPVVVNDQAHQDVEWVWDITAASPGSYVIKAEITNTSAPDDNLANNSAAVTVLVAPTSGSGGGLSGGGTSTSVTASTVKLTPVRPKAGSALVAAVRVTAAGAPVRPTRIACAGTLAGARLTGTPRASRGSATCIFHPPKSARGKTLRGSISLTAHSKSLTRRFAAKLG